MHYDLNNINKNVRDNPGGFAVRCEQEFDSKVKTAADLICGNIKHSPIVLLAGPSGSGKTTTSLKLEAELRKRGINSTAISLDKYFQTIDPETAPRTPDGALDFESPQCLDMDLLDKHFTLLNQHEEIRVPHFDFSRQVRSTDRYRDLCLGENEIAIFEGIHALSDLISGKHPEAFKLYVSARSSVYQGIDGIQGKGGGKGGGKGTQVFKSTWLRMMRRIIRDNNFRGADAVFTLSLWSNIKRGEQLYILPYEDSADYKLDSMLPYEISALKSYARPLLESVPENIERYEEIRQMRDALDLFEDMDDKYLPPDSLIREFMGGSIFKY